MSPAQNVQRQFEMLRRLTDSLPQLVWSTDAQGNLDYFNRRWLDYFGHGVGLGRTWETIIHPDDRLSTIERFTQSLKTGSIYKVECRLKKHDGQYRWFLGQGVPYIGDDGSIEKWFGTCTDIHELKTVAEWLRTVLGNVPVVLWALDRNLIFTLSEGKSLEELGLRPGEVVGKSFFDIHGNDLEALAHIERSLHGETFRARACVRGRDFDTYYSPLRDETGTVTGMMGVSTDITQRILAEEDLRYKENIIELITQHTVDGLCMVDAEGRLTYMNPAFEKMTGWPKEELIGQVLHDRVHYMHPDGTIFPTSECRINEVLKQGKEACNGDDIWIAKDGSFIPVALSCAPILRDEKIAGAVVSVQDNRSRKTSEEALKRAKDAAESANQTKTRFLANMSHEIRTPLGVVLGFADLALDSVPRPSEAFDYLLGIKRNGHQLLKLIGEVLDLAKVEADRLDIESIRFSLPQVLEEVVSYLGVQAKEKGIDLHLNTEDLDCDQIVSDPTRLRQILVNLIGNAIKFTEDGHVTVEVHSHRPESNPESVLIRFEISDTGVGLTEKQKERLFQPFTQADSSMARKFGGTGLGLVLSRQLARALGGELELTTSQPGLGSLFTLSLNAGLNRLESNPESYSYDDSTDVALNELRVLVIEDSQDNQILLSRYLEQAGAKIEIASNGLDGIHKALNAEFDVVLMDIQMPVLDGYEATRELRRKGYAKPIYALTAHALRNERERALKMGFSGYLTKPVTRKSLLSTLSEAMRGQKGVIAIKRP